MEERKILLTDDEEDFCYFVKLNLEKTGKYKVTTATQGIDCIELAKRYQPDLILLDVMMPGMSGGETAEILLDDESTSSIPIVFITALIQEEELAKRGKRIGGRNFIAKPVTPEMLIKKIDQYIAPMC